MTNLKQETQQFLERHGRSADDIECVTYDFRERTFKTSFASFLDVASVVEYDQGYGSAEINYTLKLIGKGRDWWAERFDYDGSEGWHMKGVPVIPSGSNAVILHSDVVVVDW